MTLFGNKTMLVPSNYNYSCPSLFNGLIRISMSDISELFYIEVSIFKYTVYTLYEYYM